MQNYKNYNYISKKGKHLYRIGYIVTQKFRLSVRTNYD